MANFLVYLKLPDIVPLTRLVRGFQLFLYTRVLRPPQGDIFFLVADIRDFQQGRVDFFLGRPGCVGCPFGDIRFLLRGVVPDDIVNACRDIRI